MSWRIFIFDLQSFCQVSLCQSWRIVFLHQVSLYEKTTLWVSPLAKDRIFVIAAEQSHNPKALIFHELGMRLKNAPLPVFERIVTWVKNYRTDSCDHDRNWSEKMWASANESSEWGDENQNKIWLLTVSHLDGVTKAHYKEPGSVLKISILLQQHFRIRKNVRKPQILKKGYLSHSGL